MSPPRRVRSRPDWDSNGRRPALQQASLGPGQSTVRRGLIGALGGRAADSGCRTTHGRQSPLGLCRVPPPTARRRVAARAGRAAAHSRELLTTPVTDWQPHRADDAPDEPAAESARSPARRARFAAAAPPPPRPDHHVAHSRDARHVSSSRDARHVSRPEAATRPTRARASARAARALCRRRAAAAPPPPRPDHRVANSRDASRELLT